MKEWMKTDDQIEREIARLEASPYVKTARREEEIMARRREYLGELRKLERKGRQLHEQGVTLEWLDAITCGPDSFA